MNHDCIPQSRVLANQARAFPISAGAGASNYGPWTIERRKLTSNPPNKPLTSTNRRHVCCLEVRRSHVCLAKSARDSDARENLQAPGANPQYSYNRYLTVAARVVRRSLKDDKRLIAERRGESELRFAKWEVRTTRE